MKSQEISKLPFFFIIGRPRSGTTLLRTLLDAHPNICIPHESPVIINFYRKYGKKTVWNHDDLESFYNDLETQQIFGIWNIDKERLKKDLLSIGGEITFQDLIKILYLNFNSIYAKEEIEIIGDKNPIYSINFPEVFAIFENAKFIHLIRDYRDQIVSMKKMDFEMSHPALVSYRWKLSVNSLQYFKSRFPERFLTIKYEDLVKTPVDNLKDVCTFFNIKFDPGMLEFYKMKADQEFLPEAAMNKYHSSLFNPLSTSKVNSWETKLTDREVKTADMIVGKSAELAGYHRIFESSSFWLRTSVFPMICYGKVWNLSRRVINVLPYRIKMSINCLGYRLPVIYWKIMKKRKFVSEN